MQSTYPTWLPDWRNVDEYERLTCRVSHDVLVIEDDDVKLTNKSVGRNKIKRLQTSKAAFAWEFLRRNSDYQKDFRMLCIMAKRKKVAKTYQCGSGFMILPFDALPSCPSFHATLYRTLTKWGLHYLLPDPQNDLYDTPELNGLFRVGYEPKPAEQFFLDGGEEIPYDGGIVPDDMQCWWMFDASLPIAPQLQEAKRILEASQKQEYGKKLSMSKTSPADYVRYLRLLDALAVGASDEDVLQTFFPHIELERYNAKSQQFSKPREDAMKKNIIAAQALVNRGYRQIY